MAEIRTTSSTGGMKGVKPERFSMIPPQALNVLAAMYGRGAEKYNETPENPNWRKGYEWSKSYDSLIRHATAFWGGEDIDEETGYPHMAAVAFHALSLITFMEEHPEFDDRYKSKSVSSDRSGLLDMLKPEATNEDILEINKKAFIDEQERAVRDIAMRSHPAGSSLKKEVRENLTERLKPEGAVQSDVNNLPLARGTDVNNLPLAWGNYTTKHGPFPKPGEVSTHREGSAVSLDKDHE